MAAKSITSKSCVSVTMATLMREWTAVYDGGVRHPTVRRLILILLLLQHFILLLPFSRTSSRGRRVTYSLAIHSLVEQVLSTPLSKNGEKSNRTGE